MSASSSSKPRRRLSAAFVSLRLLVPVLAALLVVGAPAQAGADDDTPPVFEGLKSATTCIPGPIGGGSKSRYHLTWNAATDDVTPSSKIVYKVYQATTAGGENFSKPSYTTAAGATSFDTALLPTGKTFYFVVRARDLAGNKDSNTVERVGQNLCE
jgi:hypothetical protein